MEIAKKAKNDLDFLVNLAIIVAVNQGSKTLNVINNKHFPVKKDFVKKVVVTLPSGNQISVDDFDSEAYNQAIENYNKEQERSVELFKELFFEFFQIEKNQKRELFFDIVWNKKKELGYEAVIQLDKELIDLIR